MSPRGACATLDKRFPALVYHHAVGARLAVYVSYTGPFLVFFFFHRDHLRCSYVLFFCAEHYVLKENRKLKRGLFGKVVKEVFKVQLQKKTSESLFSNL